MYLNCLHLTNSHVCLSFFKIYPKILRSNINKYGASLMAQKGKESAMQEHQDKQVWSLDQEDPLEEEMTNHSSILAWEVSWTKESAESIGSQRVRHD